MVCGTFRSSISRNRWPTNKQRHPCENQPIRFSTRAVTVLSYSYFFLAIFPLHRYLCTLHRVASSVYCFKPAPQEMFSRFSSSLLSWSSSSSSMVRARYISVYASWHTLRREHKYNVRKRHSGCVRSKWVPVARTCAEGVCRRAQQMSISSGAEQKWFGESPANI